MAKPAYSELEQRAKELKAKVRDLNKTIKSNQLRAVWDIDYLTKVLNA